ncbi:MAG: hypothetical protein ACJA13_004081 [Paraglaciecola sp.]|jgi:hypothetical protein
MSEKLGVVDCIPCPATCTAVNHGSSKKTLIDLAAP